MEISTRHANEIIKNLKSVINEDINFISPDGTIIASSDEERVGNFHEGATIVAKTGEPLIIKSSSAYEGAKIGINLPVYFEQDLIAIVGITGIEKEITQFSNIIVKMSEILIKEQFLNTQKQFKRENNRIIMELVTKDKTLIEDISKKMNQLGYDSNSFSFFAVCELDHFDSSNIEVSNLIYNSIEKRVHYHDLVARFQNKFLILTQLTDVKRFIKKVNTIKTYVEKKYEIGITVGISEKINSETDIKNAFKQADTVVELAINKRSREIKQFDSSSLEFLFFGFSSHVTNNFSNRILVNFSEGESEDATNLIQKYIKNNGSIIRASKELYIHKNTLQYRLNKIWKVTGYNPRELKDLIILYIALELGKDEYKNN
ncbi:MAG: helix-turn-helix domain-containing protein [Tenericutes bacterium]|nr:helix-turn-helix domain-containing protein [Mycoplasmatota bacterium]